VIFSGHLEKEGGTVISGKKREVTICSIKQGILFFNMNSVLFVLLAGLSEEKGLVMVPT